MVRRTVQWYYNAGQPVAPLRHEIRRYFSNFKLDESLYAIEVIVGELLANVARHADSSASIHVVWESGIATLTVVDHGPGFDADDVSDPDFESERGYGLWLVRSLADEVRITTGPQGGATVSVRLPAD